MSNSSVDALETVLVRLQTSSGLAGWGETCPLGRTYADNDAASAIASLCQIAPKILGRDAADMNDIHRAMNECLTGENYAKAAVDIACYDLLGQHCGQSVAQLLGGAKYEQVPSYYAVGLGTPDETVRRATEKVREGYRRLQLKAGGRDIEIDIAAVHKVHEAVGHKVDLVVDANRGWSQASAIKFSRACKNLSIILEQPCETVNELVAVREKGHHRVYMDESATSLSVVKGTVDRGQIDGFSMKLTRLGGLGPMQAFRDLCAANQLPYSCDDSWGGDIIAAACVHIGATVAPNLLEGVWIADPYIEHHYDKAGGIKIENGHIKVPILPGLGLQFDPDRFGEPVFSTN